MVSSGEHLWPTRGNLTRPELDVPGNLELTEDSILGVVSVLTSDQSDTVSGRDRKVGGSRRALEPTRTVFSESLGPPVNMVVALPGIGGLVLLVIKRTINLRESRGISGRGSHPSTNTDISHRRVVQVPSNRMVSDLQALDAILLVHAIALGELEVSVVSPSESLELTECTSEVHRLIPENMEVSRATRDNEVLGVVELLEVVAICLGEPASSLPERSTTTVKPA